MAVVVGSDAARRRRYSGRRCCSRCRSRCSCGVGVGVNVAVESEWADVGVGVALDCAQYLTAGIQIVKFQRDRSRPTRSFHCRSTPRCDRSRAKGAFVVLVGVQLSVAGIVSARRC